MLFLNNNNKYLPVCLLFQVEFLCDRGADVNRGQRSSSLHYAACFGRPQVAKVTRAHALPETCCVLPSDWLCVMLRNTCVCVDSTASRSEPRPERRGRENSSGQGPRERTQRGGGNTAVPWLVLLLLL